MDALDLWSVPVPVRRSTFETMASAYDPYNVEVDLAQIAPFGFQGTPADGDDVLHADLQCNADGHAHRRLGSGRSGYFKGKYLKGMGRTPLAANWRGNDRYHSSGHLLATGAAREYLVSAVLAAGSGASTINACEAVLARELADADRSWLAELRGPELPLAPVDLRLQAITVKDGGFARLSNFLWALDHFGIEPSWLADYFLAVRRALGGEGAGELTKADVSPGDIARAFGAAFERGLDHFATYRRLGVDWGSYHNNFTADGRFLDLEVPLVVGQPFVGWLSRSGSDVRRGKSLGVDAGRYVRQMRDFIVAYRARLQVLPAHLFSDLAMDFLRELLAELEVVFPPEHILFDTRALGEQLVASLAAEWNMAADARRDTRVIVEDSLRPRGELDDDAWHRLDLRELPQRFRPAEAGADFVLHAPASLLEHLEPSFARGAAFDTLVRACDEADSLTRYFDALTRGKVTLEELFAASADHDSARACG